MRFALAFAIALIVPALAADSPPRVEVEFLRAEFQETPLLIEMKGDNGLVVYTAHDPFLTNADIVSATASVDGVSKANVIRLVFTPSGKEALAAVTAQSVGKPIAITLNGKLVAAPTVMEPITDGEAVITGNFAAAEADRIAAGIVPATTSPTQP